MPKKTDGHESKYQRVISPEPIVLVGDEQQHNQDGDDEWPRAGRLGRIHYKIPRGKRWVPEPQPAEVLVSSVILAAAWRN
ncbi:MAG: hypothetical protein ACPGLY_06965 [Rubripirellula sp.]